MVQDIIFLCGLQIIMKSFPDDESFLPVLMVWLYRHDSVVRASSAIT